MYCSQCKKKAKNPGSFCAYCGAPQTQDAPKTPNKENTVKNKVILLIERAMEGDDSVWGEVYEKTNRYVYFMALKFLRSEQDAQDITQEVYIQAIRSVGQLYSAYSFFGWLRSIVYSKCKDFLKKKTPSLLEDEASGWLEAQPEIDDNFLPDMALDNAESKRMILELIDALPYHQRQTVLFYYYDEMTIDRIANLMECPPGTVKSRLNYARQQIKSGVEDYAKKGIKLYGVASLPIISMLLKEQANIMQIPPSLGSNIASIIQNATHSQPLSAADTGSAGSSAGSASSSAATGGMAAAATAATSATATTMVLSTKIILCMVAVVLAIGVGLVFVSQGDLLDDLQNDLFGNLENGTFAADEMPITDDAPYAYNAYEQLAYDELPALSRAEIAEAFLQVLHSYGAPVFTGWNTITEGVISVSIIDLDNEGIPELILSRIDSGGYYIGNPVTGRYDIKVYGFSHQELIQLVSVEGFIHEDSHRGGFFGIYALHDGGFYAWGMGGDGDLSWGTQHVVNRSLSSHSISMSDWHMDGYEYGLDIISTFYIDNISVAEGDFNNTIEQLLSERKYLIGANIVGQRSDIVPDISMTFDEAIAYLLRWLYEDGSIQAYPPYNQYVLSALLAYRDFIINANHSITWFGGPELFNNIDSIVDATLIDFDGDGIPEMVLFFDASTPTGPFYAFPFIIVTYTGQTEVIYHSNNERSGASYSLHFLAITNDGLHILISTDGNHEADVLFDFMRFENGQWTTVHIALYDEGDVFLAYAYDLILSAGAHLGIQEVRDLRQQDIPITAGQELLAEIDRLIG